MEVALLLFFAGLAGAAVRRMRLPAALGYLAVGVAVSPFTPGYVADRDQVQLLADAGLVLLLFELGVELDFRALRHRYRRLSVAAIAQVAITAATTTAVLVPVGFEVQGAAAVGLAVALSSTVIIVNITRSSRRTTDQPTEESLIAWSLVQDVSGVILGTLLVSGIGDEASAIDVLWVAARLIGFAVLMFAVGRWLLPRILTRVERQPESERAVPVSALTGEGVEALIAAVETRISANRLTFTLDLDPADGEGISWLHRHAEVLDKSLRDDGRFAVTVRVDPAKAERVRNRFGLTKPTDDDAL